MPDFKLQDHQTGKVVTVSGATQPNAQQAEEIFKNAGLRGNKTPYTPGGLLPSAMGTAGALGGGVLGALGGAAIPGADLTGAPEVAGAMGGGALGGGIGQAIGEWLQQKFSGKEINLTGIATQGGQGALFGGIPGDPEAGLGIKLLTRFGYGLFSGGGAKILQNLSENKPIPEDVLGSALSTGALTSFAPEALGNISKVIFGGNQKQLETIIAKALVTEKHINNQDVVKNLDLSSPINSINRLRAAAKKIYEPISKNFDSQVGNLGNFINDLTAGGSRVFNDQEKRAVNEALIQIENSTTGASKDAVKIINQILTGKAKNQAVKMSRLPDMIESGKNIPLTLEALTNAKKAIGNMLIQDSKTGESVTHPLYQSVQRYIEDSLQGHDVKGINKAYYAMNDAADMIYQKFGEARGDVQIGPHYNWIARIAMSAGLSTLAKVVGIPTPEIAAFVGIPMTVHFAQNYMMQTPERAAGFAKTAGAAEAAIPKITEQITQRLSQLIPQAIKDAMGASQTSGQDTTTKDNSGAYKGGAF